MLQDDCTGVAFSFLLHPAPEAPPKTRPSKPTAPSPFQEARKLVNRRMDIFKEVGALLGIRGCKVVRGIQVDSFRTLICRP